MSHLPALRILAVDEEAMSLRLFLAGNAQQPIELVEVSLSRPETWAFREVLGLRPFASLPHDFTIQSLVAHDGSHSCTVRISAERRRALQEVSVTRSTFEQMVALSEEGSASHVRP